ncbi:DUF2500 domain-containing protein [Lysinibacillus varians]|uniref:DUF2500 domain-containing protein n=1 Tax=Lysinibacillus varians TaxID=1145276 RepID=UPI001D0F6B70|nr:DUF2500 domain-containing protein [Lysinibacillus varians]
MGKNNNSPKLTVPSKIVTKRSDTRGGSGNTSAHTSYYVTFEVQSGERLELKLDGRNYGQLAEHDFGILPFQGTRFKAFERQKRESYDDSSCSPFDMQHYFLKYLPEPPSVSPRSSILL